MIASKPQKMDLPLGCGDFKPKPHWAVNEASGPLGQSERLPAPRAGQVAPAPGTAPRAHAAARRGRRAERQASIVSPTVRPDRAPLRGF